MLPRMGAAGGDVGSPPDPIEQERFLLSLCTPIGHLWLSLNSLEISVQRLEDSRRLP